MKVAQHQVPVMEANKMDLPQQKQRPRTASLAFEFPRANPLDPMAYQRSLSPGGRRLTNPASTSGGLNDPYRYERHNSYSSPRTSNGQIPGVIPISTQTFGGVPPAQRSAGPDGRFDAYSGRPSVDAYSGRPTTDVYSGRPIDRPIESSAYTGRPRRSSLVDSNRGQPNSASTSQLPQRRPNVVQQDYRPASPQKGSREKDYYVTPASSKEPRKTEHKKLYTVADGSANLVADVDVPAGGERHHKRRESLNGMERGGYRTSEKDRGRRGYHLNGPSITGGRKERPEVGDDDFKYTDPAGMYNETEPAYRRPEARPRRGSVDRGGANSRERPISMIEPSQDPRSSTKTLGAGPPPSYRGWDRVNEMGRANSVRERGREVPQSPHRARVPQSPTRARVPQSPTRGRFPEAYGDRGDPYYVPPRRNSMDRQNLNVPNDRYDRYEYDERKEPRHRGRRESLSRANDRSVERRGFGIRADSQDRYGRGSDESFEGRKYRDSAYAEPHRRDTAPEVNYRDDRRLEQERKDRLMAEQLQNEEQQQRSEREMREREPKRRDDDRGYDRGYDRPYERERDRPREQRDNREYDLDREREMERERMMAPQQPPQPQQHERHHSRQDSSYRDFPRESGRKESGPRESSDTHAQPGLSTAATAGLVGAAATYGVGKMMNRDKDDREKDRDAPRDRERDRDRDSDRAHDKPRDAERERRPSPRFDKPPQERRSDEGVHMQHDRSQMSEPDRGLGFAFEGAPPQPPRSAPPMQDRPPPQPLRDEAPAAAGAGRERDMERDHGDKPAEGQQNGASAEDDYRRRMEQVKRELGRGPEDRGSESDPDRERRRREREQRRNERNGVYGSNSGVDSGIATPREMPGSFGSFPEPSSKLPQREFEGRGYDDRGPNGKPPPREPDARGYDDRGPPPAQREYENRSFEKRSFDSNARFENESTVDGSNLSRPSALNRKPSILDQPMGSRDAAQMAQIIDNSQSERRENRVKIVDPPTEEEDKKPKGILKKPTEKFPENPNVMREGVAPLKDAKNTKGIPPGARWTRIDRRLVNPESLEEAKERFEERQDCVIVLRVLTKEEIQKFADRTNVLREKRESERREQEERESRHSRRNRDRRERDEYEEENSEDEFKARAPKMLEAPGVGGASGGGGGGDTADFRERRSERDREREREREREGSYVSSSTSKRREKEDEYSSVGKRRDDDY